MRQIQNDIDVTVEAVFRVLESFMRKGRVYRQQTGRTLSCFVYVLAGSAKYHFNDRTFIAREGDLISIIQNDTYYLEALTETYHYIFINYRVVKEDLQKFHNEIYRFKNQKVLRLAFERLNTLWICKEFGYQLECKSVLYTIIQQVMRHECFGNTYNKNYNKIKEAVDYLSRHYTDKDFKITQMMEFTDLSAGHFRRLFKEAFSTSPGDYLNVLRVERAKDLLANKQLSISDVAEQSGYSSVYYFSKIFKIKAGETPSQYRSKF